MKPLLLEDFLDYKCLSELKASPLKTRAVFSVTKCNKKNNCYVSYLYAYLKDDGSIIRITGKGRERTFFWLDNDTIIYSSELSRFVKDKAKNGEKWTSYYSYSFKDKKTSHYMDVPLECEKIFRIDENNFAVTADYDLTWPEIENLKDKEKARLISEKRIKEESYLTADEIPFRFDGMGFRNNKRTRLFIFNKKTGKTRSVTDKFSNVEFISCRRKKLLISKRKFTKDSPRRFDLSGLSVYDFETDTLKEYIEENTYRMRYVGFMGEMPVFAASDGKRYGYQENPYFFYFNEEDKREHIFAKNELSVSNAVTTDTRFGGGNYIEADEKYIYYVATEGGNANIKRVSLNGKFEKLTYLTGTVDFISLFGDEIIFIGMLDNSPQEIYSLKDGKVRRLSNFNRWVKEERTLSTPERLDYENEHIAQTGYVIKPIGFEKDKKYPGILYIHGGHKMSFGPIFYHEMQLWANEGYFVFYTNPRGSDGYDNVFADIIGKYGRDDYKDLMKFTDEVIKKYAQLDEGKIGVGGGSYGGFMTNWIIGHTNRFRCACSQRSIANFISMFGTGDTNYRFPVWDFETKPWTDASRYWEHSPLKYADKAVTPTLFINSENDFRCPISEGMQMFSALKYHGVEAKLCIFKGEGHELSRGGKPVNRINRIKEITSWWNRYLK